MVDRIVCDGLIAFILNMFLISCGFAEFDVDITPIDIFGVTGAGNEFLAGFAMPCAL